MKSRNKLFATLASIQLVISLLLASAIVWGYMTYQASVGQFVSTLAASIGAVSNVVIRTAETVEARKELLDEMEKMLVVTRSLVTELGVVAESHAKLAPQYAAGLQSASSVLGRLVGPFQTIGEKLMGISVPNIHMERIKPVVTMSKPFEEQGRQLKEAAQEVKIVSETLSGIATSIDRDGQKASSAFIATSEQAIKVISEIEKTLSRLKTQDLPKAIADLKFTSENLRSISAQVDMIGNVGGILLIIGLLLASWCFVHSVGALLLAKSHAFGPDPDQAAVIINS